MFQRLILAALLLCVLAVGAAAQDKKGAGKGKPGVAAPARVQTAVLKIEGMH